MAVSLTACGSGSGAGKEKDTNISSELTYDHSMELTYAEEFSVDYYNDGYALATVADDGRYLIVPEGKEAPDDLAKDIIVLKQPLTNIYLVASAVMDMFVSIDALDSIRFSSQKEDGNRRWKQEILSMLVNILHRTMSRSCQKVVDLLLKIP